MLNKSDKVTYQHLEELHTKFKSHIKSLKEALNLSDKTKTVKDIKKLKGCGDMVQMNKQKAEKLI